VTFSATVGMQEAVPAPDLRRMQISEFTAWLRSRTNKHHRPFQADTIAAYADAGRALSEWMSGQGIDGDFTACDTAMLNRFFADYLASHEQGPTPASATGGTSLPGWKRPTGIRTRGPRHCTGTRRRRSGPRRWPRNSFRICSSSPAAAGRAGLRTEVRDHAMIRVLTEGVRRTELIQLQTTDLST
jgi:integrase/recombinase XerD